MKKKLLFILIGSIIFTMIIYKICRHKEEIIFSFGIDNNMTYNSYIDYLKTDNKVIEYYEKDLRIIDLLTKIEKNIIIKNKRIKEYISSADIIIINIGQNDLLLNDKNNDVLNNLDLLIKEVKSLNDKKIILIGIYNPNGINKYYKKVNNIDFNFLEIAKQNNINYIKINNILSSNREYLNKGKLNNKSHKYIASQIKKIT